MSTRTLAPAGVLLLSLLPGSLVAQARDAESLDPTAWGVVYDIAATPAVRLHADGRPWAGRPQNESTNAVPAGRRRWGVCNARADITRIGRRPGLVA